jgi:DhnA family fructose-bisphosphate aldolase class Ia
MPDSNTEQPDDQTEELKRQIAKSKEDEKERNRQRDEKKIEAAKRRGRTLGEDAAKAFHLEFSETFNNLVENPTPEFKAWLAGESDIPKNANFRVECLKLLEKQAAKNGWEKTYYELVKFIQIE